ncbi:MAG: aldo/keto reductase [Treponema sp.]|nr:aldo/keto reductase [Treponema sp.]
MSLLGFGGFRLPVVDGGQEIDQCKLQEMVDYAIAHGVNYFDTAYYYHNGTSETCLGELLSKYPRNKFNLATKMPLGGLKSERELEHIFHDQLKKCKVDFFDFYLLHNVNKTSIVISEKYHIYDFLKEKQRQGFIRHIGFSFHDAPDLLKEVLNKYDVDFVQIQLNYMDWELQNAKMQYQILKEKGIPITVMEPVRGGMLAVLCKKSRELFHNANPEVSIASWALRYAASFPEVLTVLSGMSNFDQLQDNIKTFERFNPLNNSEREIIENALTIYKKLLIIPCTACRYCMDCPQGVDIPGVFGVYNNYNQQGKYKKEAIQDFFFRYGILGIGKQAHLCIQCKQCVRRCPQHIDIPYWMKTITSFYRRINIFVKIYGIIKRIKKEGLIISVQYYINKYLGQFKSEVRKKRSIEKASSNPIE